MKRFLFAVSLICTSLAAESEAIEADWPLMSYVGFLRSHAASTLQHGMGEGITLPGLLAFDEQGALVYAGPAKPVTSGAIQVLAAAPADGAAQLSTVLAEFGSADVGKQIDAAKPTLVVVVLGGEHGASCTSCGSMLAELAPIIEKDGRAWNIVEATVPTRSQD